MQNIITEKYIINDFMKQNEMAHRELELKRTSS